MQKDMNTNQSTLMEQGCRLAWLFTAWLLALNLVWTAKAYPPGPYHVLYGTVRDQYGTPLSSAQAQIVLQTPTGVQLSAPVAPGISIAGVNYLLRVPLDSGVTPDLYQPNVLVPTAPFKLVVVIGTVTNLPIEMTTTNFLVGSWAQSTRVDLTLGIDSNGDGLPDAWETALLASLGLNIPLSSLDANSTLTPDGLTLEQEFLLGSATSNPGNPFQVTFLGFNGVYPALGFPTVTGRSYTVRVSPDLIHWTAAAFNLPGDTLGGPTRSFYLATSITNIEIYVAPPPTGTAKQFYQIQVQ